MTSLSNHKEREHSLLSPSSSHRWMKCPPSALLADKMENKTSSFAEEGTLAHELGEYVLNRWLKGDFEPYVDEMPVPDDIFLNPLFSEEMPREVEKYVLFCTDEYHALKDGNLDVKIEAKYSASRWIPDCDKCTCDFIAESQTVLHVIDLKYGKGVRVSAQRNSQLMIYALAAADDRMLRGLPSPITVKVSICQPRLDHYDTFEISYGDLIEWANTELTESAKKASVGYGDPIIGEHCQFCPVKPVCIAWYDMVVNQDFPDEEPKEKCQTMSDDEVVEMLAKTEAIKSWIEKFHSFVYSEAMAGKQWPGYKLVEGRSSRKITDPEKVASELLLDYEESQVYNTSLKGITDLEKLVGKKLFCATFADFIKSSPGQPKLVPEDAPGREYSALSDFDEV